MSRTYRSHRRGCFSDLLFCVEEFGFPAFKATADGPRRLTADRRYKRPFRRRDRYLRKRIDAEESRPVTKAQVAWDFW